MYGIYANIWGILMVNVTIYSIHGSYGTGIFCFPLDFRGKRIRAMKESCHENRLRERIGSLENPMLPKKQHPIQTLRHH